MNELNEYWMCQMQRQQQQQQQQLLPSQSLP
jgi:hypothetical protein